jgi:uncharacterized protein YpmB
MKEKILIIIKWIFSIFFFIWAITEIGTGNIFPALFLALIGLLIFPLLANYCNKIPFMENVAVKGIVIVVLFFAAITFPNSNHDTEVQNNEQSITSQTIYISVNSLNIREKAGKEYNVIGQVKKGDEVTVLSDKDSWTQIQTNTGINGYVSSQYLSSTKISANKEESDFITTFILGFIISLFVIWQFNGDETALDARFKVGYRIVNSGLNLGCLAQIIISAVIGLIFSLLII